MDKGTLMKFILLSLFTLFLFKSGTSQTLIPLQSGTNTSIRGLSVVTNSVAWISGSNGWTAHTSDMGKTWNWKQLAGYEKLDFRDIEAFSAKKALIVSAGSPAVILLTKDGGLNWKEVYRNNSPDIFLDGMDFWDNKRGIIYGDPIKGRMQLLKTKDGGLNWDDISNNVTIKLAEGEASFAASGTAIRCRAGGKTWIATGGTQSRIFYSDDFGKTWDASPCPIIQGQNSTGPFSLAFSTDQKGIVAGGDYLKDTLRTNNLLLTDDGGKTWIKPTTTSTIFGYRSAVEYISEKTVIATGTSGTDISYDGGKTWQSISSQGFNSVRKSKKGNWVLFTGSKGQISTLKLGTE